MTIERNNAAANSLLYGQEAGHGASRPGTLFTAPHRANHGGKFNGDIYE